MAYPSDHMQKYTHYTLGMHFPKYRDPSNRTHALVKQNAAHLYRLNKNNDRMQRFLVVFCIRKDIKEIYKSFVTIHCPCENDAHSYYIIIRIIKKTLIGFYGRSKVNQIKNELHSYCVDQRRKIIIKRKLNQLILEKRFDSLYIAS